jgi:hypothetical protein
LRDAARLPERHATRFCHHRKHGESPLVSTTLSVFWYFRSCCSLFCLSPISRSFKGPDVASLVAGLYLIVQLLEGNLVTPIAQNRANDMPPAVVVVSQFAVGAVFGSMGLIVATPLVAIVLVLVRELYVEGEDRSGSAVGV